jgi:purine-nucleoside phosphorylase
MALSGHFGWLNPEAWKPLETKSPSPYSRRLLDLISGFDSSIQTGIYASVTGPCYETPAEIGALKAAGADAVGMSTAHEVDTAHRLGLEVGAISLITNRAAGITGEKLSHREVLETAKRQENRLSQLIESLCSQI